MSLILALSRGGYQNDHLGTPQKIVSTSGRVVWSATYDAFGNIQIAVAEIKNNLRFPGQYYDAETGLYYNWNRYYDPVVGRYLQTDPVGEGMNLYAYVGNNPVNWIDPEGLAFLITDMINRTTTFDPRPEDPNGIPITIPTRNVVVPEALEGANDPFSTQNIEGCIKITDIRFGKNAYIAVGDSRARDIHAGGSLLGDRAFDPYQELTPTLGCTRRHNQDIQNLCRAITEFKKKYPDAKIPYRRHKSFFPNRRLLGTVVLWEEGTFFFRFLTSDITARRWGQER